MRNAVTVRRPVLVRCAPLVIAGVVAVSTLAPVSALAQRTPTGARAALKLENATVLTRSLEGGAISGTLLSVPGPDGIARKQLGPPSYGPIAVEVGMDAKPVLEWIAASWETGRSTPRNGSLLYADFNYKLTDAFEFSNATIVEATIPALDGSSKEVGTFAVTIAPSLIRANKGSGQDLRSELGLAKQKLWLTSNFRFELPDLPTDRVARINSFTVRHGGPGASAAAPGRASVAGGRDARSGAPGSIDFPNLVLEISMADLEKWREWHDDFVVKGNNGDDREKAGAIVFLTPDMKTEMARIGLSNCGIVSLAMPPAVINSEKLPRFTVELYCERMKFVPPAS